jgi:hypothetical protein
MRVSLRPVNYGLEKDKIGSRHMVDGALQYTPDLRVVRLPS